MLKFIFAHPELTTILEQKINSNHSNTFEYQWEYEEYFLEIKLC